jgi:Uma2 family endonuclease
MNEIPRQPKSRPTTQAAEGIPRLRWTLAEFERLAEFGIFTEEDRIELIGGELVPMSPKGNRHEVVRDELMNWFIGCLPKGVRLSSEIGWGPDATAYAEPDLLIYPRAFKGISVPGGDTLLVIEVADSSWRVDTTAKANLYARLGVRDYWVVNARTLVTRIYRHPSINGFANVVDVPPNETLLPLLIPSCAVKLVDLDMA